MYLANMNMRKIVPLSLSVSVFFIIIDTNILQTNSNCILVFQKLFSYYIYNQKLRKQALLNTIIIFMNKIQSSNVP